MSKTKKPKPLSAKLIYWWHPTLNGDLIPEDFNRWSKQVIWFLHYDRKWKQWHAWDSMLSSISRKENCPICTGHRLVVGINDLATRNPTVAAMWHPTLNGDLTPQMFTEHAKAKVWWRHKDKETGIWHEWPMPISKLTSKEQQSCSICSGQRIQVGANDLATTHPDLASEWHSTLNGALTPQMVSKGIEIEVWWQKDCFNNGIYHIWHAMPNSRTGKNPKGCAICYGKQIQIGVNDLASQYPTLALEWDEIKNKKLTPQMVTKGYTLRVFWKHKDTDGSIHGWPASPNSRTGKNPSGCPECVKYAFDPALPAHLYVLFATIKETQVIQFGISNDIQTRLIKHTRSGFINAPVKLIFFRKGISARTLERSLINLMKDYDISSCSKQGIKFDGSTEAFRLEDVINNEEFLEEFTEFLGLRVISMSSR